MVELLFMYILPAMFSPFKCCSIARILTYGALGRLIIDLPLRHGETHTICLAACIVRITIRFIWKKRVHENWNRRSVAAAVIWDRAVAAHSRFGHFNPHYPIKNQYTRIQFHAFKINIEIYWTLSARFFLISVMLFDFILRDDGCETNARSRLARPIFKGEQNVWPIN